MTNAFDSQRVDHISQADLTVPQALTRAAGHLYSGTIDGHEQALQLLNPVIAAEPGNFMALPMCVESEMMLMACRSRRSSKQTITRQCLLLANRSVSLAPGSDYAYAMRSMLKLTAQGDLDGGLDDAKRAIELSPSYVWGRLARAQAHLGMGQLEFAQRAFNDIVQISDADPYLPLYAHMLCRSAAVPQCLTI